MSHFKFTSPETPLQFSLLSCAFFSLLFIFLFCEQSSFPSENFLCILTRFAPFLSILLFSCYFMRSSILSCLIFIWNSLFHSNVCSNLFISHSFFSFFSQYNFNVQPKIHFKTNLVEVNDLETESKNEKIRKMKVKKEQDPQISNFSPQKSLSHIHNSKKI